MSCSKIVNGGRFGPISNTPPLNGNGCVEMEDNYLNHLALRYVVVDPGFVSNCTVRKVDNNIENKSVKGKGKGEGGGRESKKGAPTPTPTPTSFTLLKQHI